MPTCANPSDFNFTLFLLLIVVAVIVVVVVETSSFNASIPSRKVQLVTSTLLMRTSRSPSRTKPLRCIGPSRCCCCCRLLLLFRRRGPSCSHPATNITLDVVGEEDLLAMAAVADSLAADAAPPPPAPGANSIPNGSLNG